jgi:uncharacterized protein YgiM (DUF1202 family)
VEPTSPERPTVKRGRCSNAPEACSLARDGTLLAWAGIDSICPECGAPLALIGPVQKVSRELESTPPVVQVAQDQPVQRQWQPAPPPPARPDGDWAESRYDAWDNQPAPRRGGGVLMASVLLLLVLIGGFVAWRLFATPADTSGGFEAAGPLDGGGAALSDFVELSPPDMLEVTSAVVALDSPTAGASTVGQIAAGTMVDVTGLLGGPSDGWARIVMPDRQTMRAWIPRRVLARLEGMPQSGPLDPALQGGFGGQSGFGPETNGLTATPQVVPRFIAYVAGDGANVRSQPGASASLVARLTRGEAVIVNAAAAASDGVWYRIDTQAGGEAWVKADLLGRERPQSGDTIGTVVPDSQQLDVGTAPDGGGGAASGAGVPDRSGPATDADGRVPTGEAAPPGGQGPSQSTPPDRSDTPAPVDPPQQPQATQADKTRPATVVVAAPQANLRSSPVIEDGNVIAALSNGASLRVLQRRTTGGRVWYQVRTPDGTSGWVSSATVTGGR